MTDDDKLDRKRIIMKRRLKAVAAEFNLPGLSRRDMYALCMMLVGTLGEDGVPDIELRIIYKLACRGLLRPVGLSTNPK